MKNQKGIGNVILVVIIAVVLIAIGVGIWYAVEQNKNTNTTFNNNVVNKNTNINTNTARNTNTTTNNNFNTNNSVITEHPVQTWQWGTDENVVFGISNEHLNYNLTTGEINSAIPEGYTNISLGLSSYYPGNPRLIVMQKDNKIYMYDRQTRETWETSLPAILNNGDIYETVRIKVFSTDGQEMIVSYSLYDKNSEEYKSEYAGPIPSSRKGYRYNIVNDTYVEANEYVITSGYFDSFYKLWNRETNMVYNYLSGEGTGDKTPIQATDIDTGVTIQSPDYGPQTRPYFSPDNTKIAVIDSGNPYTIYLFNTDNIETPYKTFTIPNLNSEDLGGSMLYTAAWSHDNTKLALGFNKSLYLINIDTATSTLLFTDEKINSAYLYWDRNWLLFSPEDTHVLMADFDNPNQTNPPLADNLTYLLGINLETKEVIKLIERNGMGRIEG